MVFRQGAPAKVWRTPQKGEPYTATVRVVRRAAGNFSASIRGEKSFGVIRKKCALLQNNDGCNYFMKTLEKPAKQAGRLEKFITSGTWFSVPIADSIALSW
jgi:hypothetical protein